MNQDVVVLVSAPDRAGLVADTTSYVRDIARALYSEVADLPIISRAIEAGRVHARQPVGQQRHGFNLQFFSG